MRSLHGLIGVVLGLASIGLGLLAAGSQAIGLQPCGSLDVSLGLSGCLRTFDGQRSAFSPDGTVLAVAGWNAPSVELRRVEDGVLLRALDAGRTPYSLAFSPDGEVLAVGAYDEAQLWRVADGALLRALPHALPGYAERVVDAAFSPDGALLATATAGDPGLMAATAAPALAIRVWRVADGALVRSLDGHRLGAKQVLFAPDGASLAAVLGDGTAAAWDAGSWAPRFRLTDPEFFVQHLAFAPDGRMLVASSGRLALRLLRADDGATVREIQGDVAAFSPDGSVLATANGWLRLWRVADGAELRRLEGHGFEVEDVAFSPDGARLVSAGGYEGTVRVWRVADGALLRTVEVPGGRATPGRVTGAAFLADGATLVSRQDGWGRGQIRLWSPEVTIANLPKWLGVAAAVGLGLTTLWFGLPRTGRSAWPWRWLSGILLIGGSFMLWGPLWLLGGDVTNYVVIFFGALFTFGLGLRQISRSLWPPAGSWWPQWAVAGRRR